MLQTPKFNLIDFTPPSGLKFFIKACENFKSANKARKSNWNNVAASRLYYSAFHLSLQLLEIVKMIHPGSPPAHGIILRKLDDYLRPKFGPKKYPGKLNEFYNLRVIADYRHASVKPEILNERFKDFDDFKDFICQIIIKESGS